MSLIEIIIQAAQWFALFVAALMLIVIGVGTAIAFLAWHANDDRA